MNNDQQPQTAEESQRIALVEQEALLDDIERARREAEQSLPNISATPAKKFLPKLTQRPAFATAADNCDPLNPPSGVQVLMDANENTNENVTETATPRQAHAFNELMNEGGQATTPSKPAPPTADARRLAELRAAGSDLYLPSDDPRQREQLYLARGGR